MTPPKPSRALAAACRALDAAIALLLLSAMANTFASGLVYRYGYDFLDRHFAILFWLVAARVAAVVPWSEFPKIGLRRQLYCALAAVVLFISVRNLFERNFSAATQAMIATRFGFGGMSDSEIAADITDHNKWYPNARFVEKVKAAIPPDASVAFFGDQRGHIMSYLLYPRRVYMIPAMQIELNEAIQRNWLWTPMEDPLHPKNDFVRPRDWSIPQAEPLPEIQEQFGKMAAEKKIEWAIYYDSVFPENCWFGRIE